MTLLEVFHRALVLLAIGLLIGAGMKAIDWAIPRPKTTVEVIHSIDNDSQCLREKDAQK